MSLGDILDEKFSNLESHIARLTGEVDKLRKNKMTDTEAIVHKITDGLDDDIMALRKEVHQLRDAVNSIKIYIEMQNDPPK